MTAERYQELLGDLLDGELSAAETQELMQGLREHPEFQDDLRQHLVLWEAWSQHVAAERSTDAFVESWKAQVRAEEEPEQFAASAQEKPRAPALASGQPVPFWQLLLRPLPIALAVCAGAALATVSWWAVHRFSVAGAPRENANGLVRLDTNQFVTVVGEGVCRCLVTPEDMGPAIQARQGGVTGFIYVEFPGYSEDLRSYFKGGTTVRARGVLGEDRCRLVLTAHSLEVNGTEFRANPARNPVN